MLRKWSCYCTVLLAVLLVLPTGYDCYQWTVNEVLPPQGFIPLGPFKNDSKVDIVYDIASQTAKTSLLVMSDDNFAHFHSMITFTGTYYEDLSAVNTERMRRNKKGVRPPQKFYIVLNNNNLLLESAVNGKLSVTYPEEKLLWIFVVCVIVLPILCLVALGVCMVLGVVSVSVGACGIACHLAKRREPRYYMQTGVPYMYVQADERMPLV